MEEEVRQAAAVEAAVVVAGSVRPPRSRSECVNLASVSRKAVSPVVHDLGSQSVVPLASFFEEFKRENASVLLPKLVLGFHDYMMEPGGEGCGQVKLPDV